MSSLIWKYALGSDPNEVQQFHGYDVYDGQARVCYVSPLAVADETLVSLPDPRAFRSLNRTGLMLIAAGLHSKAFLTPILDDNAFGVGMYCAIDVSFSDYTSAKAMANTPAEQFAAIYRNLRSPKHAFRSMPSIPPSQLGIFLGIKGPQNVYTHSRWACLHALEHAEADLSSGIVDVALIVSAFSLEDPLVAMRVRRTLPERVVLCEGAAALLLRANDKHLDWRSLIGNHQRNYSYGTAHDLIMLARSNEAFVNEGFTDHDEMSTCVSEGFITS